jgi:hypothetical protein
LEGKKQEWVDFSTAASNGDIAAFNAGDLQFQSYVNETTLLNNLLSEKEKHWRDVAVHAIDLNTGAEKWVVGLEDMDFFSIMGAFDPEVTPWSSPLRPDGGFADQDRSDASATDQTWDWDGNFVAADETSDVVYFGTKGGLEGSLNALTGELLHQKRLIHGAADGSSAAHNKGAACLTSDGVMVGQGGVKGFVQDDGAGSHQWNTVATKNLTAVWMLSDGTKMPLNSALQWGHDMVTGEVLWEKVVAPGEYMAGMAVGFSCAGGRAFMQCFDDRAKGCVYNARTGVVESRFEIGAIPAESMSVVISNEEAYSYAGGAQMHYYKVY